MITQEDLPELAGDASELFVGLAICKKIVEHPRWTDQKSWIIFTAAARSAQ